MFEEEEEEWMNIKVDGARAGDANDVLYVISTLIAAKTNKLSLIFKIFISENDFKGSPKKHSRITHEGVAQW